jgi:hypothetical protein
MRERSGKIQEQVLRRWVLGVRVLEPSTAKIL